MIWGLNDTITPPSVAHQFNKLISKSKLKFIDKCCHAPMMERPQEFNSKKKEIMIYILLLLKDIIQIYQI